ncbi:P-loop containing nucleoside triphosphate hydrolase protein [Nemania sp. FL0031]|nr:P-loop containing nucleoside triphosphate hydrolase protein [Nemania sp. FL0031]
MASTMRSRAHWEESFNIQKQRLGKYLNHIDAKLSFDNFDVYLKDLEASRARQGLRRLLEPNVLDRIKEFTGAVNVLSQADHITLFLWGAIQAILKTRLGVRAHEHIINLTEANLRRQAVANGIPFHRNPRFQGRDTVLNDLHKILRSRDGAAGTSSQTSCIIHGIGGVGKTQVALEYTYRYREDYSYIFWVRAGSSVQLSTSFASFRRSLMPNIEVQDQLANVNLVRDWMVTNDRWLLVFDNADATDVDLSLFWPPTPHGDIIVTTQRRDFSHWAAKDIHLDAFGEDDGAHLILDIIDSSAQTRSEKSIRTARNISLELGGLPLLISHIAGYIEGTKAPLDSILGNLRHPSGFKRIWAFDSTTSTNFQYGESMTKVWRLALNSLKPEALRTLHIMALLSPDEVHEDLLFGDWQDAELAFLSDQRRHEFDAVRKSLIDRHLVTVTRNTKSTKLSIHRVLKKYILQQIDDEGNDKLNLVFQHAVSMVHRKFPHADDLQTPNSAASLECEQCLPHILSLLTIYRDWSPKVKATFDFATLLADTATNYMWERGLTADAVDILETGERVCNDLSHMEEIRPVYADICAIAGSVHETIGLSGRATALQECEKGLSLRQETVKTLQERGQDITVQGVLQLANAWNDVGVVKLSYGDFEAALTYLMESQRLKRLHKAETDIPWHYGELYKNLAIVKLHQGDTAGAEEDARRSCELCCSGRTEKDASTQKARSILGIVLMNIGKTDEAFKLLKGVYEVRKEILGETNLHTRNSLYLVAELHRRKGELCEAESDFRLALNQCEFSWSDESIARARYHLALVIKARPDKLNAERQREAEELTRKARETRDRVALSDERAIIPDDELKSFDFIVSLLAGRWIEKAR